MHVLYWLARCKLYATLIVNQLVCVSATLMVNILETN